MIGGAEAARSGSMRFLSAHRAQVIYLLVVPLALLVFNASARWSINYDLTLAQVLGIGFALNAVPWWALLVVMWSLHRMLGSSRLPLWGLTTISTLLTGILLHGYLKFCFAQIALFAPSFLQAKTTAQYGLTIPYVLLFVKCALPTVLTTVACIQLCENILCLGWWQPRLVAPPPSPLMDDKKTTGRVAPPSGVSAPAAKALPARAGFLRHSKLPDTATILALEAEDHYLRIYADSGSDLIRYRFTDALTELHGINGLRVHRSWWVNSDVASYLSATGRVAEIRLNNGLIVPVSLRYRSAVERELGALRVRAPSQTRVRTESGGSGP
jgi:hypothetical protein